MIFDNLILSNSGESGKHGWSGVMCCKFREAGKVEQIFSFFCEELHKYVGQKLRGFIDDFSNGLVVYVTYRLGLAIIFVSYDDCPEF